MQVKWGQFSFALVPSVSEHRLRQAQRVSGRSLGFLKSADVAFVQLLLDAAFHLTLCLLFWRGFICPADVLTYDLNFRSGQLAIQSLSMLNAEKGFSVCGFAYRD